jgi:hypothetical protein
MEEPSLETADPEAEADDNYYNIGAVPAVLG